MIGILRKNKKNRENGKSHRIIAHLLLSISLTIVFSFCIDDAAAGASGNWTQVATTGPPKRAAAGMAFDSGNGVTVLFGGEEWRSAEPSIIYGDTWEWSGTTWTQVAITGPSPRAFCEIVYDSARGRTVLFGGTNTVDKTTSGDTWEWDGATWALVSTTGPPARGCFGMVYDSQREVTVLFGGYRAYPTSAYFGDTWEWNGSTWTQLATSGPSARGGVEMAYDSSRGVTVLFGGGSSLGDTWEWNGTTWTEVADTGPLGRYYSPMAYDSDRGVTVMSGGYSHTGGLLQDTWEWNGIVWTQTATTGPSPRFESSLAYDSSRRVTVLFGGKTLSPGTIFGDTWEYAGPPPANLPPVANAGPGQIIGGTNSVILDGSGSTDPDSTPGTNNDIEFFDWYEGDTLLGSGEILECTLPLGIHIVRLEVADFLGETDSDVVTIDVQNTTPPVASADGPLLAVEGSPVTMDASASYDPEGATLIYYWDFGDDSPTVTTAESTIEHTYANVGTYSAALVVSDGALDSDPLSVEVTVAPFIRRETDAFLTYLMPLESRTRLPANTPPYYVVGIFYGETIEPATFEAKLNRQPFDGFTPVPGTYEEVEVPLDPRGKSILALTVKGTKSDDRTATDRDRLVFIVEKNK